jgi:hypothetical protein
VLRRYEFSWSAVRDIVSAGVASIVLLMPVLLPYLRYASSYGAYPHPDEELAVYSLPLANLFRVPSWMALWGSSGFSVDMVGIAAFPGVVTCVLAGVAIILGKNNRAIRRAVWLSLLIAVVAFLLALGPVLTLHGAGRLGPVWLPNPGKVWLSFSAIRWPMRIFLYSALFVSVMAGIGLSRIRLSSQRSRVALAGAVFLLAFIELMPAAWYSQRSLYVKDPIDMSDAYPFLASESDKGGVVELPASMDSAYAPAYATRYAYASAGHLRGVAAFHGSLFPPLLETMRLASYELPDSTARKLFVANGVTRLVIHKDLMPRDSGETLERAFIAEGYPLLFGSRQSAVFALDKRDAPQK